MPVPADVQAFRDEYRRTSIGPGYRGWLHFATTSVGSLSVIAFAALHVHAVRPLEWLTVPVTFLFANFAEYHGHRGPMHHRTRGLSLLYQRHTREHHRYFTHEAMAYDSPRDFKMVLFPPVMLLFFLGVLATPVGTLLFFLVSPNVGWLYVMVAMSYFLTYEWLHFAYHLDPGSSVGRLPTMARLRRHHTVHHDQTLMTWNNFNITFPICDWVYGTTWAAGTETAKPRAQGAAVGSDGGD